MRVAIDPNIRLRNGETFAGLEDVEGGEPAAGDEVWCWVPETDIAGPGRVTGVDADRGLVYLAVDWPQLRPEAERRLIADAHRGEFEDWGEVLPPTNIKPRRLSSVVSVRFLPGDVDKLFAAAKKVGVPLSTFVRESALRDAERLSQPVPPHTCGGVGCRWCDPLGRSSVTFVSTGLMAAS